MTQRTFELNGEEVSVTAPDDMPLLWVLRDEVGLTGPKYGCGIGMCGACSVHLDGDVVRSCQIPVGSLPANQKITTIEGLAQEGTNHPVQDAWIEASVPQCGYCQTGMIMAASALLEQVTEPTDDDIDAAMSNICRCGTYPRIRKAIQIVIAKGRTTSD